MPTVLSVALIANTDIRTFIEWCTVNMESLSWSLVSVPTLNTAKSARYVFYTQEPLQKIDRFLLLLVLLLFKDFPQVSFYLIAIRLARALYN